MSVKKTSYDFYLILATAVVLAIISGICVYGMFYFKYAQIHQMDALTKAGYMNAMNRAVSPFIIALILLLGICVPKRLLPTAWLNRFALCLFVVVVGCAGLYGVVAALKLSLVITLALQLVVLGMALAGNRYLNFEKKGYWVRVGSSAMHLGLILFILDLFYYKNQSLHLALFWVTTIATVIGMTGCFYSESISKMVVSLRDGGERGAGRR